ncbi:hypothetical protein RSAG8_11830, partial [Rhizoctonia solani AG-8 WAC10335]
MGLTEEEADDYAKQTSITIIAAMVLHPKVQKKAQEELDSVFGNERVPTLEDRARLGYVDRIVQETLRWGPVGPLALPHTCFQDDTYKGYRIPKGAIVAMTHDETVYKNADVFDPDRYLDPSTPLTPGFRWGRRHCPGTHFAEASLFITIASVLTKFDIGVAQDENGKDIIPSRKMNNSSLLTPQNFIFKLTPRSTRHEELIRSGL